MLSKAASWRRVPGTVRRELPSAALDRGRREKPERRIGDKSVNLFGLAAFCACRGSGHG